MSWGNAVSAIDQALLPLASYPFHHTLSTRVSDLDGYGHLNAIRIGHLYEDARARFYMKAFGPSLRVRTVVAQLTLRYLAEGFWPGEATVGTGVIRIGRTSFVMGQSLWQGATRLGVAETVVVHTSEPGATAPWPDDVRALLEGFSVAEAAAP